MKVFVISLQSSLDRRATVVEQMGRAGVGFEFFDALSGALGHELFFSRYDEHEYLLNCGRPAVPGEIGCYASHRALWQRCVDLNEPIIIMEDDFSLDPRFSEAVQLVGDIIGDYGYLRLQVETRARKRDVRAYGDFMVHHYTKVPHSMMCYALVPDVAMRLLERSVVLDAPVDVMLKKNWEYGVRLHGLSPYTVSDYDGGHHSTIPGRVKYRKPWRVSLQRAVRKVSWMVRAYWFNRHRAPARSAVSGVAPE